MPTEPKILCLCDSNEEIARLASRMNSQDSFETVPSPLQAIAQMSGNDYDALLIASSKFQGGAELVHLLRTDLILDRMPDGVVLLDSENKIAWSNRQFVEWVKADSVTNVPFYDALGELEILGPTVNPLSEARAQKKSVSSEVKVGEHQYFKVHVTPVFEFEGDADYLVVSVHDTTTQTLERQKLESLHQAGSALADLKPQEIFEMDVDERIDLLKVNILHFTQNILNFDVVEIRLLDQETGRLEPLLSEGIDSQESKQALYARAQGNGVTGFVAATGKSYSCEDTTNDPLYLDGLIGAKSSLTVPLIYHDQVIGSFNVESPEVNAFDESDLQFLEIFSRDVARALNTLELLVAQGANTAMRSVEAIHSAVAMPIDEILNDSVHVIEKYIGHDPEVVRRLRGILQNARDIKQVIQKVGEKMAPATAVPSGVQMESHPKLKGKRILVIDADQEVRNSAHLLLERIGCVVETAHEGNEALLMIRNCSPEEGYQAIIADIRLPDMDGYQFLVKLKGIDENPPLVLMTGFGYDPGHAIVKARREGHSASAILYKPFRMDQLLETIESVVESKQATANQGQTR